MNFLIALKTVELPLNPLGNILPFLFILLFIAGILLLLFFFNILRRDKFVYLLDFSVCLLVP